jgi:imidazolonepropionase-like amidohydrolase
MTPGSNPYAAQYTAAELRAALEEAHRLGRRVAAHAHGIAGIRVAVEAGVDMIEHCTFQTERGSVTDDALVAEIARRGIIVSPTIFGSLATARGTERFALRAQLVRSLLDAGCPIVMSTDAALLGLDDRGALIDGRRADLIAVEGDPTADLAALHRIRLVIQRGRIVDRR